MAVLNALFYTLAALIAYSAIKRLIDAHLLNPLAGTIPGPWHTKYTSLGSKYHRLRGDKLHWAHRLHLVYGPLVLVEPRQVSSSETSHWEHMNRMGAGFTKSAFHERFRIGPESILFSIVDIKKHAARRKLFSRALTRDAIRRNWEGVVRERVETCIAGMRTALEEADDNEGREIDMLKWWKLMTADIIAQLSFGGAGFKMLESGGESEKEYFQALNNAGVGILMKDIMPRWLLQFLAFQLGIQTIKDVLLADQILTAKGAVAVQNLREKEPDKMNLFSNMLAEAEKARAAGEKTAGSKETVDDLTDDAIKSEAAGFLLAGTDTTSVAITYIMWAILKRPQLRQRLEDEVSKLAPDFTDSDAEKLPLMNNVINEALRLYGPGLGHLVKRVPAGGVTWNGCFIPGGTEVYAQLWTLVRNPDIFSDPEQFDETRFEHLTDAQRRVAKPYSIGSRSCVAASLAGMEIRYAVALFLREFKGAKLGKNMTDEMMEITTKFFLKPKGNRCDITVGQSE